MKKIFSILTILLSLCAISVQAQSVDSLKVTTTEDSIAVVATDTSGLQRQAPRMGTTNKAKRMKIKSEKPIENVAMTDSALRKKHSPTVAGCLSIIPGGGQIYNKKYWKLPIVYGALGISGYFVYDFAHQMVSYKKEFINRRDGNTSQLNPKYSIETDANILALKNTYRRRMEIAIAITAVLYVFNIVDAIVDAHLYYFDISDDLSLRVTPQINQNYNSSLAQQNNTTFNYGVNLTLNFK
ncbi:MAG: hypothetical protein J6P65_01240 [Bacteroidales bacterium]|nr:hypothetical protein [Bacteroidales bacterium]